MKDQPARPKPTPERPVKRRKVEMRRGGTQTLPKPAKKEGNDNA